MSCICERKKLARELDRARRLAKGLATIEGKTVAIYERNGEYSFSTDLSENGNIVEYISAY